MSDVPAGVGPFAPGIIDKYQHPSATQQRLPAQLYPEGPSTQKAIPREVLGVPVTLGSGFAGMPVALFFGGLRTVELGPVLQTWYEVF